MDEQQARTIVWDVGRMWAVPYEDLEEASSEWLRTMLQELPVPGVGLLDLVEARSIVRASIGKEECSA